jgi:hypothetical protein
MDARIGQLTRNGNAVFYAFIGNSREYVEGTLEQVEAALEGKEIPVASKAAEKKVYNVRLSFQFPAWDEVDGILYSNIEADSKKDAIDTVRRMASNDGHAVGGRGKYWFSAEEAKND